MEPILELATRITTQLWYLHGLFPDGQRLNQIDIKDWRQKAEPDSYSKVQALLDLAGRRDTWTAREWLWEFERPPDPPQTKPRPPLYHPWKLYKWAVERQKDKPLEEVRECWDQLKKAWNKALDTIEERTRILQDLAGTVELLAPETPEVDPPAQEVAPAEWQLTREGLYERVAEWLMQTHRGEPVRLARVFLKDDEFFIEEDIYRRAQEAQKKFPRGSKPARAAQIWMNLQKNPDQKLRALLNSRRFRFFCMRLGVAVPFSLVLRDELDEIERSRLSRLCGYQPKKMEKVPAQLHALSGVSAPGKTAQSQAFDSNLFGVALSGGGIRSATFALGLLQGLADRNILPYVDILSTVSGGGYIGSWLISWIKRKGGVKSVQESMRGNATNLERGVDCPDRRSAPDRKHAPDPFGLVGRNADPEADHTRPIRLLRDYARYLAPQAGLFSADTWTIVSTWARNTLLNLLILIALLGVALLTPRIAISLLLQLHGLVWYLDRWWAFVIVVGIWGAPLWIACAVIGKGNLTTLGPYRNIDSTHTRGFGDHEVVFFILPFIMLGAFVDSAFIWYANAASARGAWAFGAVVAGGIAILSRYSNSWDTGLRSRKEVEAWMSGRLRATLAMTVSAIVGGVLVYALYSIFRIFEKDTERGVWIVASAGTVLMLMVIGSVVVLFIGLMGNDLSDEQREWWGRLGAWHGLAAGGWLAICAICFFMPLWMAMLGLAASAAGVGWATITGWGAKLAYSPKSGRNSVDSEENWLNSAVLNVAPAVFVIGMLSAVSFGLFWLVGWVAGQYGFVSGPVAQQMYRSSAPFSLQRVVDYYWTLLFPSSLAPLILIVILGLIGVLLSWRVDVNEFSMHNFYKNRLVRCYLGASRARAHRAPNAFTSFDFEDDIRLFRFQCSDTTQARDMVIGCQPSYAGPFPIVNTALNVTQGADLGLQERKAESFVFTPLWSGFDYSRRQASVKKTMLSQYGFRRTDEFGEPRNRGVFLGTAMAISGAAFNSNAGFHTSPTLAFLLTVFGVRLGWWAGNPRTPKWTSPSPGALGLAYLAKELTANTRTDSGFVLLSDGGHFENMGLYELIRRRCRFIILSDAEEDEKFKLEGIGGAIRKCRVDFGVVIDLNLEAMQPLGNPAVSHLHYSLGTIRYPGEETCGKLVYVKSSVTGDEPVDVVEFRNSHAEFPHTSTADQFFDESHFESYRALGQHVAEGIFYHDVEASPIETPVAIHERVAKLFTGIEEDWQKNLTKIKKKKKGSDKENQADTG
ncbi:MAG: patatin-like phospholipase family protein [Bryobacteraceae bacterium]|jgi:hypothetical protein